MPTYEYRCEQGHTFEEFQSMLDAPLDSCPVCGAKAERLISGGTGLIFKGSGFYITDYARKKSGASQDSAKANPASEKKTPDKSSSDSKPASKSKDD
jgi:putative FmdB family regulatory protein